LIIDSQTFFCPDEDSADEFMLQTDINVWPKKKHVEGERPKIVVFCFFHAFSPERFCEAISLIDAPDGPDFPRILFFGDPVLIGINGYSSPMKDMLASERLDVFTLEGESSWSQSPHSPEINQMMSTVLSEGGDRDVPWSNRVQLCDPSKFKEMYDSIVSGGDPTKYHFLCTDAERLNEMQSSVRIPPGSFRRNDKIWDIDREKTQIVEYVWPLNDEMKTFDQPSNYAVPYKKNHKIGLLGDDVSDHESCCGHQHKGEWKLSRHNFKWITIQKFSESKTKFRDHVILIVSNSTRMRHVYAACCMAREKITLVCNAREAVKAISKREKENAGRSLLKYVTEKREKS
jgi:hypothetical protein